MFLIIIGPPGSGKGTQAKLLSEHFNLDYFESGEFLRGIAQDNSRIRNVLNSGELVDEKDMTRYVTEYFEEEKYNCEIFYLTGFPGFRHSTMILKNGFRKKV